MEFKPPRDERKYQFWVLLNRIEAAKAHVRELGGTVLIVRSRETGVIRVCLGIPRKDEEILATIGGDPDVPEA